MSKQSEAKKEQGYNPKQPQAICSTCIFYESANSYNREVNMRCGIGDFAVKKQGGCKLHEFPKP